jgi:hypothetical protein
LFSLNKKNLQIFDHENSVNSGLQTTGMHGHKFLGRLFSLSACSQGQHIAISSFSSKFAAQLLS